MQNKLKILIPSIADVIFSALFLTLALSTPSTLLMDSDAGMHIKIGEQVLNYLSIPKHDIYSSATPPLPYIAYEWLSQAIMAFVHRLGGLTGIVIFYSLIIAFSYYLMFKILKKENANIIITVCVALLVISASSIHWLATPHMFSILIIIVWYHILDLYQYKDRDYLYALPVIMLFWVNLHGAFILGFACCLINKCYREKEADSKRCLIKNVTEAG
ncbi:MAG: hypothetical protein JW925_08670, partial [Syntrophaceae bacterium]|nr:hypothetical protein [Syntrophaceae bacterium]